MPAICPVCQKPLPEDARHRPFCSARCHLQDLGKWLDGDYRLPAAPDEDPGPPREAEDE